jgi:predicted dehydrogenase
MGRTHARHYSKIPSVRLTIYDVDETAARALAEAHEAEVARSFEELLGSVDAVDICLPTHLHREIALSSLRAKKPTLCEKPLARTVAECAELVEESERSGTLLMPAQVVRFFPEFRTAHSLVAQGKLGRIAAIRTRRGGGQPKGAGGWFQDPSLSGGVFLDLAVHDFDWILWTFGPARHVFAQCLTGQRQGLDYGLATITLQSGALAHVEATWADPGGFRVTFEIAGSEGFVEYDSRQRATVRWATTDGLRAESNLAPHDDPYYLQLHAFVRAVRGEAPPPVSALEGARAVAIAEAAWESARTGRPVPPASL